MTAVLPWTQMRELTSDWLIAQRQLEIAHNSAQLCHRFLWTDYMQALYRDCCAAFAVRMVVIGAALVALFPAANDERGARR